MEEIEKSLALVQSNWDRRDHRGRSIHIDSACAIKETFKESE